MGLPVVSGNRLSTSLADFERSCLVQIAEEQQQSLPNNALINVLCEAVRLSRESVNPVVLASAFDAIMNALQEALNSAHDPGPWAERATMALDQADKVFRKS